MELVCRVQVIVKVSTSSLYSTERKTRVYIRYISIDFALSLHVCLNIDSPLLRLSPSFHLKLILANCLLAAFHKNRSLSIPAKV